MQFEIKECRALVSKRGKVVSSERIDMPDGESIKKVDKMDICIVVF